MRRWLALSILAMPLRALDPTVSLSQYARKQWHVEDGLPQNYVTWISQSADGYLLVGTAGGAARFDGLSFTPLVLDAATGRSREWITIVQPGADGKTVWVATRDDGFYELGRRRWPYRLDNLIVDRRGNPIGLGQGLYRRQNDDMQRLRKGVSPADPSWSGLSELPDGGLLAATAQGLLYFRDPSTAPGVLLRPDCPEGRVLAIAPARRGGHWLGTSAGLYHARLDARGGAPILTAVEGVRGPVVSILDDRDGALWAATWGSGLWRVVGGRAENFSVRDGLEDKFVHVLFEDREGNLWIGTRSGLSRWKSTPIVPFGPSEGLEGQFSSTVSGDAAGNIWLGTWRSGLYRFRNGRTDRTPLYVPDLRVLVRATASGPDGSLWLSDWTGMYRRSGGRWERFDASRLGYDARIHALIFDRKGRLWTGAESGLYLHAHTRSRGEPKLAGHSIRTLLEDSRGRIWAGGPGGLWRLDGESAPAAVAGLPNAVVTSVSEDSVGRIWATTRANGLALISEGGVTVLDQRHGLPALPLYAVVDDGRGSLWASSPSGVFELRIDLVDELLAGRRTGIPVIAYGQEDGMRTVECQGVGYPSAWKDRGGDIWFPTVRGAVRIRPRTRQVPAAPAVLVESVRSVRQSHSIRFTAARLGAPSRVEFRYRMATQPDWTYLGGERTLRYDSLPAGQHTLLIAAREWGGDWGEPTAATLNQPPRRHETAWFRLAAAAGGISFLLLLYRWRMYILRGRYSAVLTERNRISREWHDTLLAGFSAISWQLDMTLKRLKENPEKAADAVETARSMVHHYRAEARRVIWDLRQSWSDPESLEAAIARALQEMTGERGIAAEVAVEGHSRPMPGDIAHNLLRICQEAASNAIHHGEPTRIDVKLRYGPGEVAVMVRDNGRGFDPRSVPPGHFGLQIMRERARRFGGDVEVAGGPGTGASITAAIPLPAEAGA